MQERKGDGAPKYVPREFAKAHASAAPAADPMRLRELEGMLSSLRDVVARRDDAIRELSLRNAKMAGELKRTKSTLAVGPSDLLWLDAFNGIDDAVIVARADGVIVRHNAAAELMFGEGAVGGTQLQALIFDQIIEPDVPRHDLRRGTPPTGVPIKRLPFGHELYRRLHGVLEGTPEERIVEEVEIKLLRREPIDVLMKLRWIWDGTGHPWTLATFSDVSAAHKDELTGVFRRRVLMNKLRREVDARTNGRRQNREPLALLMVDGDHFKDVNDAYGHQVGDAVLRKIAGRIASAVRDQDLVARYGGEEFTAVLDGSDLRQAFAIAERIRRAMESRPIPIDHPARELTATVSIGVAGYEPGDTPATLIAKADRALYEAKEAGRNRVICRQ